MRLFFALWPGPGVRAELAALGARLAVGGRGNAVPEGKLHMTLAFLGEVPVDRFEAACNAASRVRAESFDLVLDEAGSFRAARVAWAGASHAPRALASLQSDLAGELGRAGFELESRPFAAHVTLVRRAAAAIASEPIAPVAWRVDEFVLVASDTGRGTYEVGEKWRLGPGPSLRLQRPG